MRRRHVNDAFHTASIEFVSKEARDLEIRQCKETRRLIPFHVGADPRADEARNLCTNESVVG
jgi:hypothetical protein